MNSSPLGVLLLLPDELFGERVAVGAEGLADLRAGESGGGIVGTTVCEFVRSFVSDLHVLDPLREEKLKASG